MSASAVMEGDYADLKFVKTRSVVQMLVEFPIERGPELVRIFGTPIPGAQVPVAIARLVPEAARKTAPELAGKRKLSELSPAAQAALTCQREAFWRFLTNERKYECNCEEDAADFVRGFCEVGSRAELATNEKARQRWNLLLSGFEVWLSGHSPVFSHP